MKVILKYANGAEEVREVPGQPHPIVFQMPTKEGATFWFQQSDQLPSGALIFTETSKEEARRIWQQDWED